MENKTSNESTKESKINQNVLIAIIGAVTTIAATIIGAVLNNKSAPAPTPPPPLIITATSLPVFPTETALLLPTETATEAVTFTPTVELPTATATEQIGIYNAILATDIKGILTTTRFKPDQVIYLLFDINDPTNKNIVRIVWSVVDVKGFKVGAVKYDITDIAKAKNYVSLTDHTGNPWDTGKYKVEIYLNDVLDETIEFEIVP